MGGDRRPAAVLWDMDGTLVDTEPYWIASEHALVAEFGGTWTDDDAHSIVGFDLLDAAVELRDRGGVGLEPVEIVERLLDGVIGLARAELPLARRGAGAARRVHPRRNPVCDGDHVVATARRCRTRRIPVRVVRRLDHR